MQNQFTALMHASGNGERDVVELLLELGAHTNLRNNVGIHIGMQYRKEQFKTFALSTYLYAGQTYERK